MATHGVSGKSPQLILGALADSRSLHLPCTCAHIQPSGPQTQSHTQADASPIPCRVQFKQEVARVGRSLSPYPSPCWGGASEPGTLSPHTPTWLFPGSSPAHACWGGQRSRGPVFPLKVVASLPGGWPEQYPPERVVEGPNLPPALFRN